MDKVLELLHQFRQIEKKSVIIGLIIIIPAFCLVVSPILATVAYGVTLQETSQDEGYESVEAWQAALYERKSLEAGTSEQFILELDGYITDDDKRVIIDYEKGLAAAKSFAEFNEIYASREI